MNYNYLSLFTQNSLSGISEIRVSQILSGHSEIAR